MAGMVRYGGIAALLAGLMFGLSVALRDTNIYTELSIEQMAAIISELVATGCLLLAFWTTKTHFNAHGYRRADTTIFGITALLVLWLLYGFANLAGWSYNPYSNSGIIGTIINILPLIVAISISLLFAIQAIGFASNGGIWNAIGIVYLVAASLVALSAVVFFALAQISEFAFWWGGAVFSWPICLVMIASLTVHGIGLLGPGLASPGGGDTKRSGPLARSV